MRITTGIDIIEVKRVQQNIEKFGRKFLEKIYTPKEIEYCESKKTTKFQSYAVRFAGKEAVFKAISTNLSNKYDIEWTNIEILNDTTGRPYVAFNGKLHQTLGSNCKIEISLSHIKETAIASVVARMEDM